MEQLNDIKEILKECEGSSVLDIYFFNSKGQTFLFDGMCYISEVQNYNPGFITNTRDLASTVKFQTTFDDIVSRYALEEHENKKAINDGTQPIKYYIPGKVTLALTPDVIIKIVISRGIDKDKVVYKNSGFEDPGTNLRKLRKNFYIQ